MINRTNEQEKRKDAIDEKGKKTDDSNDDDNNDDDDGDDDENDDDNEANENAEETTNFIKAK